MSLLLPLLPLLAQVGPFNAPVNSTTPLRERPRAAAPAKAAAQADSVPGVRSARGQACLSAVDADPEEATGTAITWLAEAKGPAAAEAQLCLGLAHSALEDWSEAAAAFSAGRDGAGADRMLRARLGAMAGSALLAGGNAGGALAALDTAQADAKGLASADLDTDIGLDRARALVALKRPADAETALAQVRSMAPTNPEAWLLSATLARRSGNLKEAQARIERAAELLPIDPEIGLEAGVIAVLAGHDGAARKSWESVLVAAPDSPAAASAKAYLAQLPAQVPASRVK